MPEDMLSDVSIAALIKALDGAAMRHRALANNIANAETPGFTRSDVAFQERLRTAVQRARAEGSSEPIKATQPRVVQDLQSPARADGNNVDIEREMAALAKNTLHYEAAAHSLAIKLAMIRSAINEGRR